MFENELKDFNKEWDIIVENKRKRFVEDFPINRIVNLSLDEFLIAKKGYGNENSFCRRLSYGLKELASVGNMYFKVFGIYLNNGTDITLSDNFKNMYNYDFERAFMLIKELVVSLLNEVGKGNYEYIDKCELNGFFKYRLLIVYYPDLFIPVTAEETINGYCNAMNISFSNDTKIYQKNLSLSRLKKEYIELDELSNFQFMGVCDQLWRANKIIDYSYLTKK